MKQLVNARPDVAVALIEQIGPSLLPLVVLTIFLCLLPQIRSFLTSVESVDAFGVRARRKEASERLEEMAPGDEADLIVEPDTSGVVRSTSGGDGSVAEPMDAFTYFARHMRLKLERSKFNVGTSSAKLSGEIAGSAYADLKLFVRMLAFARGEASQVGTTRGRTPKPATTLAALGVPTTLAERVEEARRFATDVMDGSLRIDGSQASVFIDQVIQLQRDLFAWHKSASLEGAESSEKTTVDSA